MNQKLKTDTGDNESSNTHYIKPKLAAALASLEVQLDRELARYRRTRLRERKPDRSQFWASTTNGLAQSQDIPTTQSNQTLTPEVGNIPKEEANAESQVSVNKIEATTSVPPHSQVNPQPSNLSRGDTKKLEIDRDVKEKQSSEHVSPEHVDSEQVNSQQPNSSQVKPKVGNIIAAEVPQNQKTQASPTEDQTIIQSPEDYLESSEELLRSFSAEKKSSKKSEAKTDIFFTPLGIASMLLLLITCILVGWVAANPGDLPKLSFGRLFKQNSDNDSDDSLIKGSSRSLTQPQITPIPKQPNLATQEFPEVKNPDDVVNLKPKPTPTTTLEPELNPVNKPNVESNESQSSVNDDSVTQVEIPQATEETQKTESDADIKPSADGFYHVVVDNQGEESVTKARQVVPDAYVSDDGKLIHLGALKAKERAKKLVSELKSKGLNAKIK
ncbi:hypothetical protein [Mastigocoleus testarum]|uniref:SPOR domain-containing protein n=1 Tax=Mastigocoleus testarum BC008 TaxID=371196 RepID=A0A0V7ZFP7_9CYAN|nr:hypothetical protein [Mastigocoleus testarum]KST63304.1 hypothetical protein BC008_39160 [Mastigocoleus testarum BC008]